jgi:hypothetical protein
MSRRVRVTKDRLYFEERERKAWEIMKEVDEQLKNTE